MKQLIQNFKSGELYVDDVPMPALTDKSILVENKYSLISAGTEKGTVNVAKANLIGKAKQRPDLVAQVLQNVKKEGVKATMDKVRTKLDSLKALGYSTSGKVLASLDSDGAFKPGDRVACAGQDFASHAEVVNVPQNLVVKIPDNVSDKEASFTTMGAIAMQGVRQADPKLGDSVCVIGLGLLGQITCQLLKANGCRVFGIDLNPKLVDLVKELSADESALRSDSNVKEALMNFTKGYGFDSVIITAAAPSNDPIELSAEICRKKGTVVVVGAVKMDIPRDPHFYRKELELKMSCSYGPGRYDHNYEENGVDYPYAYVRWTEQRNMSAFLDLIAMGKLNIKPLISHVFDISEAENAYDIIIGKIQEDFTGILLEYPENENKRQTKFTLKEAESTNTESKNVGFVGAGSFAQSYLIPNVRKCNWNLSTVVTSKGITAKNVGSKFGFESASAEAKDVIDDDKISTVFIATQHNTHAKFVLDSIKKGKNVFVEKPLAMKEEELDDICEYVKDHPASLMVGFNRRFAPVVTETKKVFEGIGEPLVMNIRVNAGFIPKDHWTQNDELGGGRIIGEMCHFVDLMQYYCEANPVSVYAVCIDGQDNERKNDDNIAITLKFSNGSVGNLVYVANGDKSLPKERIEVFAGGKNIVINDFRSADIHSGNKINKLKEPGKGHAQEVASFLNAIEKNEKMPISFESIERTTRTMFRVIDSLVTGLPQKV